MEQRGSDTQFFTQDILVLAPLHVNWSTRKMQNVLGHHISVIVIFRRSLAGAQGTVGVHKMKPWDENVASGGVGNERLC